MPENETKVLEFEPREWKDDKEGGTPIDALALNRMEQGIADAVKGVNDVNLNLMTYLVESDGETATLDINGRPMPAPCYIYDKSEMVTWFDSGVEGEARVNPFPSQADMQAVRDSLGRRVVIGGGVDTSDVAFSDGRPVFRVACSSSRIMHLIMGDGTLGYFVCDKDGQNGTNYTVQMVRS